MGHDNFVLVPILSLFPLFHERIKSVAEIKTPESNDGIVTPDSPMEIRIIQPIPNSATYITLRLPISGRSGSEKNSPFYQDLEQIVEEYEAAQEEGGDGTLSQAYLDLQTIIQSSQSKHDGAAEGTHVGNTIRSVLQNNIAYW